jgi:serine/threonine protein kinase
MDPPAKQQSDAPGTFLPGVALTPTPVTESYDFIKKIGSGAFSIVHEAVNKRTGDRVAIKVVKKIGPSGRGDCYTQT